MYQPLKRLRFVASKLVILMTAQFLAVPAMSAESHSWEVGASGGDGLIRYITHGTKVYGHEFGFLKNAEACDADILWISWTTSTASVTDWKGHRIRLRIVGGGADFEIDPTLLSVLEVSPTLTMLSFTNFLAGPPFFELMNKVDTLEVSIAGPEEFVGAMDVSSDEFDTSGFSSARSEARRLCLAASLVPSVTAETTPSVQLSNSPWAEGGERRDEYSDLFQDFMEQRKAFLLADNWGICPISDGSYPLNLLPMHRSLLM